MTESRWRAEQEAWDAKARERAPDESALQSTGESWAWCYDILVRGIGPKPGDEVLDCGCGEGFLARAVAARRASVTGFDVSSGMMVSGARLERGSDNHVKYVCSVFERLPFKDDSFDAAVGMFVLHHVDLDPSVRELARVLRPGGRASFIETWQRNPLLRAARRLRGRCGVAMYGTHDESPLLPRDIDVIRAAGFDVRLEFPTFVFFRLFNNNVLRGRRAFRPLIKLFEVLDRVLGWLPPLRRYSYYAFVHITRS